MMETPETTWTADWPKRVRLKLREQGFETVRDFLYRFPAEPYDELVKRIAPWVAAMQLSRLQMEEARRDGTLREAAIDSLCRNLNALPDGWVFDSERESRAAAAAAHTTTSLVIDAQAPDLKGNMLKVYETLKGLGPPLGWRPSGPRDRLIQEAFASGWPKDENNI